jgi:N-acetylneuraminic acid mutarotase
MNKAYNLQKSNNQKQQFHITQKKNRNKMLYSNILRGILAALFFVTILVSCSDDDEETTYVGNWVYRYEFKGVARNNAVSFTINNKAYIIGGASYENKQFWHSDVWEYTPESNSWVRMDSLPSTCPLRTLAVAFSVGNKGYYGTGYDNDYNKLNDFWKFDPLAEKGHQWTRISDFEGSARYGAVAFAINGKAYLISGFDGNYLNDTWEFNPDNETWTEVIGSGAFPGSKRMNALSFILGDKAYICTGKSNSYVKDFWEYDATNNTWTEKRKIMDLSDDSYDDSYTIIREFGSAFVIDSKAYVTLGQSTAILSDVWEYDPTTDLWERKTDFEGTSRTKAVAFSVDNRGFILTGNNSTSYFDDVWEFKPNDEENEND